MNTISFGGKGYQVDGKGFLLNHDDWDENFANGTAALLKLGELTEAHWKVIRFIRDYFSKNHTCPLVYETGRANGLLMGDLKRLFPTGYTRGACKLAGIAYEDRFINYYGEEPPIKITRKSPDKSDKEEKSYRVDVYGYLVDPAEWDREFAINRAHETKLGKLSKDHWKLIDYLRGSFEKSGEVPTVYETCEKNGMELSDLEKLFPDGYQRGAVKIAGLRVK